MQSNNGRLFSSFLKYVTLNILGMLGLSCYILADTYFISAGVGASGLTALNLVLPVYSFLNGIGLMLGMGGATKYTILRMGGGQEDANKVFGQTLGMAGGLALLFTLTGVFATGPLVALLGADGETAPLAQSYLRTILCFSAAFLLNNVCLCFVRNDSNPNLSMYAMLAGSFSNILLDYLFIFPLGMGMFGAAFATALAPIISLGVLTLHRFCAKRRLNLTKPGLRAAWAKDILTIGFSSFITEFSSGIIILFFNFTILGIAGNTGVAAYGVLANLALIVVAVFTGVAQGTQPLFSRAYGGGHTGDLKKLLRWAAGLSVLLGGVFLAAGLLFDTSLVGAFNRDNDPRLTQLAVEGIWLYFPAFLVMGVNILAAAYFAALHKPAQSILLSLLRGAVLILPLILILPGLFGMKGVWLVIPCAEGMALLVSAALLCWEKRRPLQGNA